MAPSQADGDDTSAAALERALIRLVRLGRLSSIHEQLAARAGVSLDRALYGVLATLDDEGPLRLSDLATRQGVDASTTSRHVAVAEQRGLVTRAPDPGDRRAAHLALTPAGRQVLGDFRRERRRLLEVTLGDWDEADRLALVDLLDRLNNDLARVSDPRSVAAFHRIETR